MGKEQDKEKETPKGPDESGSKGEPDPKTDPSPKTYTERELQSEVDRRVQQAVETIRGQVKAEHEAALAQAAKEAEEKRLKEQGEFKQLCETQEKELAELKGKVEQFSGWEKRAKEAEAIVEKYLAAEIEGLKLDEATKELLAGRSAIQQLEWIAKHKSDLAKRTTIPGTPPEDKTKKMSEDERRKQTAATWL